MDYFDTYDELEISEKKLFEDNYKKQMKITKTIFKILGFTFLSLGAIVLIILMILALEFSFIAIPFIFIGLIFVMFGFLFPNIYNYEKYKNRLNKYGCLNMYELNIKVAMLEEKNNRLEARVKQLEETIEKI